MPYCYTGVIPNYSHQEFNGKVVQADVGPTDNQEVKIAQENNVKNESAGPSLWLLTVGLLGFVMLSNRSGV